MLDSVSETTILGSSSKRKKFPESDYDATKKGGCPMCLFSVGYLLSSVSRSLTKKKCWTGRPGFDKVISVLKQQYSSRSLDIN